MVCELRLRVGSEQILDQAGGGLCVCIDVSRCIVSISSEDSPVNLIQEGRTRGN